MDSTPFWSEGQPGFRFSDAEPGSQRFFDEVSHHRYSLEPHILEIGPFSESRGKDVLEVGCGIGTDGALFAQAGARYTGVDQTTVAVDLAQRRFAMMGLEGMFVQSDGTSLPFPDESFDVVYSHGVIHHIRDTATAVAEFHRVLRPNGLVVAMVYHRDSLNYRFNILVVRRLLALVLLLPGGDRLLGRVTGRDRELLTGHQQLFRQHGVRYLMDTQLFLSNNTDGPGNPLSKVYSRKQLAELFRDFVDVETTVRYLNLRLYPKGDVLARSPLAKLLERRYGWHLYVRARRGSVLG